MSKIRVRFSPLSLAAIALISALIFAFLAFEALRAQYFEHGGDKSYFIDEKDFYEIALDSRPTRIIVKSNKIFSFRNQSEFVFGVSKYKTDKTSPDGVSVKIYADDDLIAQTSKNPYHDKNAPYIEDGFIDAKSVAFNMPKATKTLSIEFACGDNCDLDVIEPIKLRAHKANAFGVFIAAFALLSFIAAIAGLTYFALKRSSNARIATTIRDYFNNEKNALFMYRAAIAVLFICVAYFIMISAGFTFNQEGRFHLPISLDDFFLYHAPRNDGRFFPLANTDYNLLWFLPYGYSAQGFYFVNLITFIAAICGIAYLINQSDSDKIISRYINAFFLIVILLSLNRSIRSFMEIIYPERLLSVTIVLFMIFYKKALDSDKIAWFIAALLSAIYATYQKEPMFGVFIVFALFALLFARKTKKLALFNVALIVNGFIFLIVYYLTTVKYTASFYGSDSSLGASEYAAFFAKTWLIVILFVFSAVRGWFIIVRKDEARLFYDATLFGACAFACAYLILGFVNLPRAYYYYSPIAFMFAPSLIYWCKYLYFNKRRALFWTIAVALALSCKPFNMESAVASRRNNHDFIVSLIAYAKLDKRIIIITDDKQINWRLGHFMDYVEYAKSKTYRLDYADRSLNIELNSPNDPIDYNAIYIFESADYIDPRFQDFRQILKAKSSVSSFAAYIYDR
jgi:hypothetical protein